MGKPRVIFALVQRLGVCVVLGLLAVSLVPEANQLMPAPEPGVVVDAMTGLVGTSAVAAIPEVVKTEAPDPPALPPLHTEKRLIESRAIERESPYLVYLPPQYDLEPDRHFPVLYMLHGVGGNDPTGAFWEWEDDIHLFTQAERLIGLAEIDPMLIVLPQGEDSYFVNHADGGPQWGDFIGYELVSAVDAHFRTLPYREARAVGGLSMGGQAALQLGMNYPEVFSIVGAHSPTIREVANRPWYMGTEEYYRAYDPIALVKDKTAIARTLTIWLDVGNADEMWKPVVDSYAELLRSLDIPFTYASSPGEHHGDYWRASTPEYLRFYNRAFKQNLTMPGL